MGFINSYLLYGLIFLLLGFFHIYKRKWLIKKWYETYGLDQPGADESMKRLVILMQNGVLIVAVLGSIFFILKGLKLV